MSTPVEPATGSTITAAMVSAPYLATMSSSASAKCAPCAGCPRENAFFAGSCVARKVVDERQRLRGELPAIRLDAADGDAAESDAVVAARAADEANALRLSLRLPVRERDLQRGVDGLGAGVAEEDVIDVARQHRRQLLRELERQRMAHLEGRRVVHHAGLFANRRGDLLATVAGVHAPESGRSVQTPGGRRPWCSACPSRRRASAARA